jgi:hypothetical protein
MADPFPVASTPGAYATYSGRVVPGSIPAGVAPDLESAYHRLAPDADVFYGTFLPVAFNRPGSARWMREGTNFRWSLPAIVRDGLLGALDLANGTHSGEVTPRLAQTFAFGLPMAGIGLAERGALGAAGARTATSLPRDYASRMARARQMGFNLDLPVYRGMARGADPESFQALSHWEAVRRGLPPGVSVAENPAVASNFAEEAQRSRLGLATSPNQAPPSDQAGSRVYPLFFRSENPTEYRLPDKPSWGDVWHDVGGLFWDGHDAIRLSNYRMFPELGPQTNWLIRDPNQLRSPFAVFDPARRDSSDLLAGSAVPAPLAVTASAPGFRGPPSLAESLAYWRFMREPKVY